MWRKLNRSASCPRVRYGGDELLQLAWVQALRSWPRRSRAGAGGPVDRAANVRQMARRIAAFGSLGSKPVCGLFTDHGETVYRMRDTSMPAHRSATRSLSGSPCAASLGTDSPFLPHIDPRPGGPLWSQPGSIGSHCRSFLSEARAGSPLTFERDEQLSTLGLLR